MGATLPSPASRAAPGKPFTLAEPIGFSQLGVTTMVKHPMWIWSWWRWSSCCMCLSPGREESVCCMFPSMAAGKDRRCGGARSKAGRQGGPQPPQTREVPVHSHRELSQRLQLPVGWVSAPSLHPLPVALGLPVLFGSWFGWQLPFPWVCVSSAIPPGLRCQKEKGKERFSRGCHLWRSMCLQCAFGAGLVKAIAFAGEGKFKC